MALLFQFFLGRSVDLPITPEMTIHSWTDFFKEKVEKLEDIFKLHAPAGLSLLGYALKNNYISSAEYLHWAQEAYLLPVIKKDFFDQALSTSVEWNTWKSLHKWSIEVQPLAKWDEHLIVGCLEIPLNFPLELKPIFLLCDFTDLENLWNLRTGEDSLDSKKLEKSNLKDAKMSFLTSPNPKPLVKPPTSKLGLSDSAELILLEDTPVEELQVPPVEENFETPEGLEDHLPIEPLKDFSQNTLTQKLERKDDSKTQKINTLGKTNSGVANSKYILNLLFDKYSSLFRVQSEELFNKLHSQYEKTMILSFDAEEENFHPHFWDNRFVSGSASHNSVPLKNPSVFKIVSVTQKPFHGPIVVNEINEKFFDNWNQGVMPSHVTIVPLVINGRMAGIVMAIGEKSCNTYSVLKFIENCTQELGNQLSAIINSSVA